MRRRTLVRIRKILGWGFLVVASILGGSLWFAYAYITDSDTLAGMIRDETPKYLPKARVIVDRVQLRPLVGDVELKGTTVWQTIDGEDFRAVSIPWLQVRSDFRSLIWGTLSTREIIVAQPRLRLRRRADGTWNLQGLLADPWPATKFPRPVVTISKGVVELADGAKVEPILRDVSIRVEPQVDGSYKFEGDARGDLFEKVALAGTFHPRTGRVVMTSGDITSLAINDAMRGRLPPSWRSALDAAGVERGEVDLSIGRIERDPALGPGVRYDVGVTLRGGVWKCAKLPFPLADVGASARITNDRIAIASAEGHDGKTLVRLRPSWLSGSDPVSGPMELNLDALGLELDERLRGKTPEKLLGLWNDFSPPGRANLGRVDASVRIARPATGAPWSMAPR